MYTMLKVNGLDVFKKFFFYSYKSFSILVIIYKKYSVILICSKKFLVKPSPIKNSKTPCITEASYILYLKQKLVYIFPTLYFDESELCAFFCRLYSPSKKKMHRIKREKTVMATKNAWSSVSSYIL